MKKKAAAKKPPEQKEPEKKVVERTYRADAIAGAVRFEVRGALRPRLRMQLLDLHEERLRPLDRPAQRVPAAHEVGQHRVLRIQHGNREASLLFRIVASHLSIYRAPILRRSTSTCDASKALI